VSATRPFRSNEGRRIIICDSNALLQSVTGLLRMSRYAVFQAYDANAVVELCAPLPNIELLILNTTGIGGDATALVRNVRIDHPRMPVLHIGDDELDGMPNNVPTIGESFTPEILLEAVARLLPPR